MKSCIEAICIASFPICALANANPVSLHPEISIREFKLVGNEAIRIAFNQADSLLYYLHQSGNMFALDPVSANRQQVANAGNHGITVAVGLAIAADGTFFVVGNPTRGSDNVGIIVRGETIGGERVWSTVAESEPYARSGGRDHLFNAIEVTPDGQHLMVNSGSRTDHGEEQRKGREFPVTSAIFRLPINARDLLLPNNEVALRDYLYADGLRNSFDMAFDREGELFAVENSDTRDNPEELNWIQAGHHYGFPWRIGTEDTPQQFTDFDPPDSDPLLVPGINMEVTFYNDPQFPDPPDNVVFTDPILNQGPDADHFRDSADGLIKDASEEGRFLGTFTPHSSPLGLVFDVGGHLGGEFTGEGFCLSQNDSTKLKYAPFGDPGEDLLHLSLTKIADKDRYTVRVTRLAYGFTSPVDAVLVDHRLFVLEYHGAGKIWEISLPARMRTAVLETVERPAKYSLGSAYPNPFNPYTIIPFTLPNSGWVKLAIYDLRGTKVATLVNECRSGGTQRSVWTGTDNVGTKVASSVYFAVLEFGGKRQLSKLLLVK